MRASRMIDRGVTPCGLATFRRLCNRTVSHRAIKKKQTEKPFWLRLFMGLAISCTLLIAGARPTHASPVIDYWLFAPYELDAQIAELTERISGKDRVIQVMAQEMNDAHIALAQGEDAVRLAMHEMSVKRRPLDLAREAYDKAHRLSIDNPELSTEEARANYRDIYNDLKPELEKYEAKVAAAKQRLSGLHEKISLMIRELKLMERERQILRHSMTKAREVVSLKVVDE